MCNGVITITETITACPSASPAAPAATPGCSRATRSTRAQFVPEGRPTGRPPSAASRATSSGSGRRKNAITAPASTMPTSATRNGPVNRGRSSRWASRPATPVRFGPATAPTVVAHITVDSARARRRGAARSVAAYRDSPLAAVVAPSRQAPTSKVPNEPTAPATTQSPAPAAPIR